MVGQEVQNNRTPGATVCAAMGDEPELKDSSGQMEAFGKQVPKNLVSNIGVFLVNIVIGFLLVPFYIRTVGVALYGLVPLAITVTAYFSLVTDALHGTVARYLTVDLQKNEYQRATSTFNTALFSTLGVIAILIPILFVISFYASSIFDVPRGYEFDATLLFLGVGLSFLITVWGSNFGISLFAYNRLDIRNAVLLVNRVSQVLLMVAFFALISPDIRYIGLSHVISALLAVWLFILAWRKFTPQLRIALHSCNRQRLQELTGMGSWYLVNQIGALLFLQIDLVVVNVLLGALVAGEYAIALTWSITLRSIASTLAGVITPIILIYYAREKFSDIVALSRVSVKFMGLALALPIGLLCGFGAPLLTLWVGPEYAPLTPLLWILTAHLVVNLSVLPLFAINISYNKVRIPGIVTLAMGLGNLILAVIFTLYGGLGFYGVAWAGAIMWTLKNACFTPWYATKVMGVHRFSFVRPLVPGIVSLPVLAIGLYSFQSVHAISTWFQLALYSGAAAILYFAIVWIFGISPSEKAMITTFLPKGRLFHRPA